jgi:hypothetical protein
MCRLPGYRQFVSRYEHLRCIETGYAHWIGYYTLPVNKGPASVMSMAGVLASLILAWRAKPQIIPDCECRRGTIEGVEVQPWRTFFE